MLDITHCPGRRYRLNVGNMHAANGQHHKGRKFRPKETAAYEVRRIDGRDVTLGTSPCVPEKHTSLVDGHVVQKYPDGRHEVRPFAFREAAEGTSKLRLACFELRSIRVNIGPLMGAVMYSLLPGGEHTDDDTFFGDPFLGIVKIFVKPHKFFEDLGVLNSDGAFIGDTLEVASAQFRFPDTDHCINLDMPLDSHTTCMCPRGGADSGVPSRAGPSSALPGDDDTSILNAPPGVN